MKNYKMEKCIVAFIDVLGASKQMQIDSNNSLNMIHNAYDDALKMLEKIKFNKDINPQIKIFSDNIVVYCPCSKSIEAVFYTVVLTSSIIQEKLLEYKILSRGGISVGDFFADETMLWGQALVNAYNIESTIAIYPRIVIDPNLIGLVKFFDPKNEKKFWKSLLQQDVDGLVYIDYFHDFSLFKNPEILIITFLSDNEGRITDESNTLKVKQKFLWHNNYLNRKLEELTKK